MKQIKKEEGKKKKDSDAEDEKDAKSSAKGKGETENEASPVRRGSAGDKKDEADDDDAEKEDDELVDEESGEKLKAPKVVGPGMIESLKTKLSLRVQETKEALYQKLPNRPTLPVIQRPTLPTLAEVKTKIYAKGVEAKTTI